MGRKKKKSPAGDPVAGSDTTSPGATGADASADSHKPTPGAGRGRGRGRAQQRGEVPHPGHGLTDDGGGPKPLSEPQAHSSELGAGPPGGGPKPPSRPQGHGSKPSISPPGEGPKPPSQPQAHGSAPGTGPPVRGPKSSSRPQDHGTEPSIGPPGEGPKSSSRPQGHGSEPSIGPPGEGPRPPSQPQAHGSAPGAGPPVRGPKSSSRPQGHGSEPSIGPPGEGPRPPSQPQAHGSAPGAGPPVRGPKSSSRPQGHGSQPSIGPPGGGPKPPSRPQSHSFEPSVSPPGGGPKPPSPQGNGSETSVSLSGGGPKPPLQQLSSLTLSPPKSPSVALELPRRPDYGKAGRPIGLVANYFRMTLPSGNLYHYDVDIKPEDSKQKQPAKLGNAKYRPLGTKVNRAIIQRLVKKRGGIFEGGLPAFDGRKNIYLRNRLRDDSYEATVPLEDDRGERNFVVAIQYVGHVSMDSLGESYGGRPREEVTEAMQAVHCILKHGPTITYTPVGRSFFERSGFTSLGGGKEVWFGFTPTVQLCQGWKPMLNLNTTATVFYEKGPLLEFIGRVLQDDGKYVAALGAKPLQPKEISKVESAIKNRKLRATHLSYQPSLRVLGLTRKAASDIVFEDEGKPVSVASYFARKYQQLKHPNLPCVVSGSREKPKYYPVEVCEIPEYFHCGKKLAGHETAKMIRVTAVPPRDRFAAIEEKTRALVTDPNSAARGFGVTIDPTLVRLPGRVLDAPKIVLQGNSLVQPSEGQWGLQGKKLFRPANIDAWGVLVFPFRLRDNFLFEFLEKMRSVCEQLGMQLPQPKFVHRFRQQQTLSAALQLAATELKGDAGKWQAFLFVILDPHPGSVGKYEDIKLIGDCTLGLKTQCIAEPNVFKVATKMQDQRFPQLVCNICLKINTKCGGVNNSFGDVGQGKIVRPQIFAEPFIVLGADVNHPGVDKMHQPSFAALVGSLDSYPSQYHASVRVQKRTEKTHEREIIKDLKNMVKETLFAFWKRTQQKPRRIIFYRDGVSEGQFYEVLSYELRAIRDACRELEPGYEPPTTFVIVQKRHSTRLKPQDPREGTGRHGNVPPGTTADREITHPRDFDFYLCSHAGIQGTSRPSHYYVVHDDNNFTSDELQHLTYSLCHTYARCPRSVSMPAPAYYAHWVAFRAHQHATTALGEDDGTIASSSSSTELSEADLRKYVSAVQVKEELKTSMYFT